MDTFRAAVSVILRLEGGLRLDADGVTNFGIAKKFNPEVDVRSLTVKGAVEVYRRKYWATIPHIATASPGVQLFLFHSKVWGGCGHTMYALRDKPGKTGPVLGIMVPGMGTEETWGSADVRALQAFRGVVNVDKFARRMWDRRDLLAKIYNRRTGGKVSLTAAHRRWSTLIAYVRGMERL